MNADDYSELSRLTREQLEKIVAHLFELDRARMASNNELTDVMARAATYQQMREILSAWTEHYNLVSINSDAFLQGIANGFPKLN